MLDRASVSTTPMSDPAPAVAPVPTSVGFAIRTTRGNERALTVTASAARNVELNGDFTHWQPIRLRRAADGSWTATLPIPAGTYQMAIRLDGGPWIAPPGLLTSTDEFGGIVGILTVE